MLGSIHAVSYRLLSVLDSICAFTGMENSILMAWNNFDKLHEK